MQDPGKRIQPLYGAFRRRASRSSRARAEGGTGLGLAIVKHLMEAHGGRVAAPSEPLRARYTAIGLP